MQFGEVEEGSEIHLLKCLAQYKILTAIPIIEDVTQEGFKVCGLLGQKASYYWRSRMCCLV